MLIYCATMGKRLLPCQNLYIWVWSFKVITLLKYSLTITTSLYHCSNTLRTLLELPSWAICQSLLLEDKIALRDHLNQHLTFQKCKLLLWSKFLKAKKNPKFWYFQFTCFIYYLAPNNKVSSQKKNFIYSNIDLKKFP